MTSHSAYNKTMKHEQLVSLAIDWLRRYRCGVVLSEQYCATGEVPDAIGWRASSRLGISRSVIVECKASRADSLADAKKPFRVNSADALGSERYYLAPRGVIAVEELPAHWGLLECTGRTVTVAAKAARGDLRSPAGLMKEMNLLLASLRRVEVRIEPQSITDFLKWKNRLAEYNGGALPEGVVAAEAEENVFLDTTN